jgi:hypothetical protein
MGIAYRWIHVRVASVSLTATKKEDLHLQRESRAGPKTSMQDDEQDPGGGLEHFQASERGIYCEKGG